MQEQPEFRSDQQLASAEATPPKEGGLVQDVRTALGETLIPPESTLECRRQDLAEQVYHWYSERCPSKANALMTSDTFALIASQALLWSHFQSGRENDPVQDVMLSLQLYQPLYPQLGEAPISRALVRRILRLSANASQNPEAAAFVEALGRIAALDDAKIDREPMELPLYYDPDQAVNAEPYLDLASGPMAMSQLYGLVSSPHPQRRAVFFNDTSPFIRSMVEQGREIIGLDPGQIHFLCTDGRNVQNLPDRFGTVCLNNIATWFGHLSDKWIDGIIERVALPQSKIIVTLKPSEDDALPLPDPGESRGVELLLQQWQRAVNLDVYLNAQLLSRFYQRLVQEGQRQWDLQWGILDEGWNFRSAPQPIPEDIPYVPTFVFSRT
jgi:hypothetical protein